MIWNNLSFPTNPYDSCGSNTPLADGSGQEPQWPEDEDDKLCKREIMDQILKNSKVESIPIRFNPPEPKPYPTKNNPKTKKQPFWFHVLHPNKS